MLRELSVQNLALIEDAQVQLEEGFCAWTGETGAGKSLLLTALGLVLGQKASAELVREGKPEARAAAVFEITEPALKAEVEALLGGPLEDDALILTRRISSQGRTQAYANDLPITIGALRLIGLRLIDIHGQEESRALLDPDRQRQWLDDHGGLIALVEDYRRQRNAHDALRTRRLALIESARQRRRERELLQFELEELSTADPRPGEYDELGREAQRQAHAESLRAATREGYALLYENDRSAQGLLRKVARSLGTLGAAAPELAEASNHLARLAEETQEIAYTLRDLSDSWISDPGRLETIEARLATYRRLASRFRCEPDELAARREEIARELAGLDHDEHEIDSMAAPLEKAWQAVRNAATSLSEARREASRTFTKEVRDHLKNLGLAEARLDVELESRPLGDDPMAASAPEEGPDRIELVFAANAGHSPRPLRKTASGGEMSRVTLAIVMALAGSDKVPTLVFDEIDAGVGGRLGSVLGQTLSNLARHHQIICVTHLPQLASHAPHQWVIRKNTRQGRARTTITPLSAPERVGELAAMLRGDAASDHTRAEASAMLAEAQSTIKAAKPRRNASKSLDPSIEPT